MQNLNGANLKIATAIVLTNIKLPEYYARCIDYKTDLKSVIRTCCPMHYETKPSFTYFQETDTFACFGACNVAGNVIKLHERYLKHLLDISDYKKFRKISKLEPNNITYYTALDDLAKLFNLTIPNIFEEELKEDTYNIENLINKYNIKKKYTPIISPKFIENELELILSDLKKKDFESYIKYVKLKDQIMTLGDTEVVTKTLLQELLKELREKNIHT